MKRNKKLIGGGLALALAISSLTPVPYNVLADDVTTVAYADPYIAEKENLSEQDKLIFEEGKKQIQEIAAGKRDYAILQIKAKDVLKDDVTDSKYNASATNLRSYFGRDFTDADFDADGNASVDLTVAWQRWAESKGYFDYYTKGGQSKLLRAWWADCAFDMYWQDRTLQGAAIWPVTLVKKADGTVGMSVDSFLPVAFGVSTAYAAKNQRSDQFSKWYEDHNSDVPKWEMDTSKVKTVSATTVANAKRVVEKYKDLSDYEKLEAYRDYILQQVSYDNKAAQNIGKKVEMTDEWQLNYVFDEDPSTNIVCEGYAKAFKFLCDLTTFEDKTLDVKTVTGTCKINSQQEEHMWNIVTYGGKNYIVDLTNSDEGTVGTNGVLFMVGAKKNSWSSAYTLSGKSYQVDKESGQAQTQSWSATYSYDDDAKMTFKDTDLEITEEVENSFDSVEAAGRYLAEQLKARNPVIRLSCTSYGDEKEFKIIEEAFKHVKEAGLGDSLRLEMGGNIKSSRILPATSNNTIIYNVSYYNDATLQAKMEPEMDRIIKSLNLNGKSDYQRAKAIYDWMCKNVTYVEYNGTNMQLYTAASAIVDHKAVCQGYACAYYNLAMKAGLESRIVVSQDHSWNIVKIGDKYYNVDPTWDAGRSSYQYYFFMKSDATFLKKDYPTAQWGDYYLHHVRWDEYFTGQKEFISTHPVSETDYGLTEDGIKFEENNGTITITGYTGDATELVIPDQIAGEPVGTIKRNALASDKLTKITFTSDVANIENNAFDKSKVTLALRDTCKNLLDYAKNNNIKVEGYELPAEENSWTNPLTCKDVELGETVMPSAQAAFGAVTYKYATEEKGEYTTTAPTAAGTYYVKAYVEGTKEYTELESDAVAFKITKKQNAWVTALSMKDIKVGDAVNPSAKAKYGDVKFLYKAGYSGTYSDTVPSAAATSAYYVKAVVDETDEYTGLESKEVQFYIDKNKNEWVTELTIADITEGETPKPSATAKVGEVKFTYASSRYGTYTEQAPTTPGTYYVKATVAESDAYEELTSSVVSFKVNEKKTNKWVEDLYIFNITEGDVLEPTAKAEHGEAEYVYATEENGTYTSEEPKAAGTYYVKAVVKEDKEYKTLESKPVKFRIKVRTAADDTDVEALQNKLSDTTEKLNKATQQAEELRQQYEAAQTELTKANDDKKAAEENAKKAEALQKDAEAAAQAAKIDATKSEAEKAEAEKARDAAVRANEEAQAELTTAKAAQAAAEAAKVAAETAKAAAEAQVKVKDAEIQKLKTELEAAQAGQSGSEELQKKLTEANKKLEDAEKKAAELQTELTAAQTSLKTAQEEAEKAAKEKQALLETHAKQLADQKAAAEKTQAELQKKLDDATTALDTAKKAAEQAQQDIKAANDAKTAAEGKAAEAEAAKKAAEEKADKLQKDVTASEEAKAQAVKEKEEAVKAAELAEQNLKIANEAKTAAEASAEAAKKAAEKANSDLEVAKNELKKAQLEAETSGKETAEVKKQLDAVQKSLEEAKANSDKLKDELVKANENLKDAKDAVAKSEQEKAEMIKTHKEELDSAKEEAKKAAEKAAADLKAAEDAKKQAEEAAAKAQADANQSKEEKQAALEAKAAADQAVKEAQANLAMAQAAQKTAEEKVSVAEKNLENANAQLALTQAELENTKKLLEAAKAGNMTDELTKQLADAQNNLKMAREEAQMTKENLDAAQKKLEDAEAAQKKAESEKANLVKELEEAKAELEKTKAELEKLKAEKEEPGKGAKKTYVDVNEGDWYYDSVMKISELGIMTGTDPEKGIFSPGSALARAQLAVVLYRMAGEPAVEHEDLFADVTEGIWYDKAVTWAAKNKIITGYADTGNFGPSDNITREQFATILYRYTMSKGWDTTQMADLSDYSDAAMVSGFAADAMKWCVGNEIITGSDGHLNPQQSANRAEIAAMTVRFMEKYQK